MMALDASNVENEHQKKKKKKKLVLDWYISVAGFR